MPLLNLFWTMLMFFLFFAWIWILITVVIDVFRDGELHGLAKAVWLVFILIVPLLGVLVYLIARGDEMSERQVQQAVQQQKMTEQYIRDVSSGGTSSADELEKLARLKGQGVLTEEEFAAEKAKLLG